MGTHRLCLFPGEELRDVTEVKKYGEDRNDWPDVRCPLCLEVAKVAIGTKLQYWSHKPRPDGSTNTCEYYDGHPAVSGSGGETPPARVVSIAPIPRPTHPARPAEPSEFWVRPAQLDRAQPFIAAPPRFLLELHVDGEGVHGIILRVPLPSGGHGVRTAYKLSCWSRVEAWRVVEELLAQITDRVPRLVAAGAWSRLHPASEPLPFNIRRRET